MEKRKQVSFDIDTNVAKKIFGEHGYTKVYKDIRKFMKSENWKHIEGSVYMSDQSMYNTNILRLIKKMKEQYPYLDKCVREIHKTDISNIHSLNQYFSYDGTPGQYAQQENKVNDHKQKPPNKPSVHSQLEKNKELVKEKEHNKDLGDRTNSHHNRDVR